MGKVVEMLCEPLEALCSISTKNTKPDAAAALPEADTSCRAVVLYSKKSPFSPETLNLVKQSLKEKGANSATKASSGRITKRHKSNRRAESFGGTTVRHSPGEMLVVEGHIISRDKWQTRYSLSSCGRPGRARDLFLPTFHHHSDAAEREAHCTILARRRQIPFSVRSW